MSASDLLSNAKALRAVKKEKKPPTPKSVVSSSKAGSVKKEESKKRKLMEVETIEIIEAPMKVEKVKENFGKLVKDFTDKVRQIFKFLFFGILQNVLIFLLAGFGDDVFHHGTTCFQG